MFDANVVVSATLNIRGTSRSAIERALMLGAIALSDDVYNEMLEVLARPKFAKYISPKARVAIVWLIYKSSVYYDGGEHVAECRDPKDNRYLELALWSNAAAIVTGDKDLLAMHPWRGIPILNPADFLHWLTGFDGGGQAA